MFVYPHDTLIRPSVQVQRVNYEEQRTEKDYTLSYDDMLRLLDEIESGELEKKCTPEELERVKHFVAFLAKEGALPDNSEESLSLDEDIEDLLNGEDSIYEDAVSFVTPGEYQYMIIPAVLNGHGEVILCKSWVKKQWKHVKKFAKKHKKALIIGAAVVVAAAVVVVAVAAASSAAAGAAAAGAAGAAGAAADSNHNSDKKDHQESSSSASVPADIPPGMAAGQEAPTLKSTIDNQISSFKENIVQNQFFQPTNPSGQQGLSWEENGRALGSLFAHDSYNNLQNQLPYHPGLAREASDINSKYNFPIPGGNNGASIGHPEIDRKFSTDYTYLYSHPGQEIDFNTLSYQVRGERALEYGYYNQAVQDFGKAIEANPTNPVPYLERGIAHFGLGEYDRSLEDYRQFTSQAPKTYPLSVPDFSLGFAKGLPKGVYESGEGLVRFVSDLVIHPIRTGEQMWDALSLLSSLARSEEWGAISQALAPEVHQLVKEWDTISSDKRGELAGYAFGKYGADIVIPGALAKAVSKGVKGAQELSIAYKGLQNAEKTLILESVSTLENGAKIAEVIQGKTVTIAEKLGFNAREIAQLENIGKIEGNISNIAKNVPNAAQEINFANHALQRAVERGVSRESILDALASPLRVEEVKLDKLGRPSQRFIGQKAEVVINPETQQVVSVNPTSTKKFEKLNNELSNVKDRAE